MHPLNSPPVGDKPRLSHPLRWFPEFWEFGNRQFRSQGRLLGASLLVGIVAGLGAIVFAAACQGVVFLALHLAAGYEGGAAAGEAKMPWLPTIDHILSPGLLIILPLIGGLLSGSIVYWFAPEAKGHGTDAAIGAYHHRQGQIRARVPLVKLIASAITIGTGGSGGREGPIAQIGAGFGSLLGRLLRMSIQERRILLVAGVGAGVAAIFRAPLAGALFAAEVLYRSPEFEAEVVMPAGIASVISYCTYGLCFGWRALFDTVPVNFHDPRQLILYTGLAIMMAVLAMVYTRAFNTSEHLFGQWKFPNWLKPAVGAGLTGIIGVILYYTFGRNEHALSVLSFGYGILQDGMLESTALSAGVLIAVAVGKIATTSLTIGSGGSGGVFGPSMVIGGCAGGALGILFHQLWPQLVPHPACFMIVGMAGFFAAAAKTPFSTIIIVCEMTGGYQLLLPALWTCTVSFLLSDEQSLFSSQVEGRTRSPAHHGAFVRDVLAGLTVSQFVIRQDNEPTLVPEDPLQSVLHSLDRSSNKLLPVVSPDRRLVGVVTLDEVHLAAQSPTLPHWILAADLMRTEIEPLQLGDSLETAHENFVVYDVIALPVVDAEHRFIGLVRRSDIAFEYLRRLHGTSSPTGESGQASSNDDDL